MDVKYNLPKPTQAELDVLEVLWENGPATVRQVNDALNGKHAGFPGEDSQSNPGPRGRETGYTTTLKIMQIMHQKGLLDRKEEGRTHIYSPQVGQRQARQQLLDKFMETTFKGSATSLIMQALGSAKPSTEELKQIRRLLDKIERSKK